MVISENVTEELGCRSANMLILKIGALIIILNDP